MLSVPDWNIPVPGFKSGDPAAEADTTDWTLGIVAEEGSKLGGGEMVDISPDSEYYVSHSGFTRDTNYYVLERSGGSGTEYSRGTVTLDLRSLLSTLTRPGIALSVFLHALYGPDPGSGQQSIVALYPYLAYGFTVIQSMPRYFVWRNESGTLIDESQVGGPAVFDVSPFKTHIMDIKYTLERRNTLAGTTNYAYLYDYIMLFEIEG